MRRLGTWLGAGVLVAAAVYGTYWYQVKNKVDELAEQLAPFADVQYGTIYAHPNGTVGVNALSITPLAMHAPISISQVRIRAGTPLDLLLGSDEPPEELFVTLAGVEQSMESAFFHELQKQMDLVREANPLYISPAALGCGNIRQFDVNAVRMMGYRDLEMDVELHYRGDDVARKITFEAMVDVRNMGETRMKMAFSADPRQLKNPLMATGSARLDAFEVDYRDTGYNQRLTSLCAREAEMQPATYRRHHHELFARWVEVNGIELPDAWMAAYADLQQNGARMSLALTPIGGFGSAEMMVMSDDPRYLIEKLNPSVTINDTALDLNGVQWNELLVQVAQAGSGTRVARERQPVPVVDEVVAEEVVEAVVDADASAVTVTDPVETAAPVTKITRVAKPRAKSFQETPVAKLGGHVGAHVRIFTYFGNDVEGRLVAVDADGIRVEQRLAQGMAEYPLEYARIQQVEVYR